MVIMTQGPQDPMDPFIKELADLLRLAEKNAAKPLEGTVSLEIKKQLDKIKADVDRFSDDCDKILGAESENIIKTYKKMEDNPEELTTKEKKLIRQYGDLGTNALILKMGLDRAKKYVDGSKRFDMSKNTKKSIQKRRGKFKGMDGEGWKKL